MMSAETKFAKIKEIATHPKKGVVSGPFGSNLKTSDYTIDGIPIIRLQNVKRMRLDTSDLVFTSEEKYSELFPHSFEPGDILVSKLGDDLGRACIAPTSLGGGIVTADVVRIRVNSNVANVEYVMLAINNPASTIKLIGEVQGVTRPRVSLDDIRNLEIPLPSLSIQESIVGTLTKQIHSEQKMHRKISDLNKQIDYLRLSVLKAACEGGLIQSTDISELRESPRFQSAKEMLDKVLLKRQLDFHDKNPKKKYKPPAAPKVDSSINLPKGWALASLDTICEMKRGPFGSAITKSMFVEEGYAVFEQYHAISGDFSKHRYKIDFEKFSELEKFSVEPGDFIISCAGTIGKIKIVPDFAQKGVINQALLRIRIDYRLMKPEFFLIIWEYLVLVSTKLKVGTAMSNLVSVKNLKQQPIMVPPLIEQDMIIEQYDRIKNTKISAINVKMKHVESNLSILQPSILLNAFKLEKEKVEIS